MSRKNEMWNTAVAYTKITLAMQQRELYGCDYAHLEDMAKVANQLALKVAETHGVENLSQAKVILEEKARSYAEASLSLMGE